VRFASAVLLTVHEPPDPLLAIRQLGEYLTLVGLTELLLGQGIGRLELEDFLVLAPGLVQHVLAHIVPPIPLLLVELVLVCGRLLPVPEEAHKY